MLNFNIISGKHPDSAAENSLPVSDLGFACMLRRMMCRKAASTVASSSSIAGEIITSSPYLYNLPVSRPSSERLQWQLLTVKIVITVLPHLPSSPSFWADIHETCESIANTSKPKYKPLQNKPSWRKRDGKKCENSKQRLNWKSNTDRKRKTGLPPWEHRFRAKRE